MEDRILNIPKNPKRTRKGKRRKQLANFWGGYRKNRAATFGLAMVLFIFMVDVLAPIIAPYDPLSTKSGDPFVPPSAANLFGTDDLGRDIFSGVIFGARVSSSGKVLDPDGLAISTAPNSQFSPSIAFDGTNYLVVWVDTRFSFSARAIYGARVSQFGTVLDPIGSCMSYATQSYSPAIAFDGTNYLVVWQRLQYDNFDIVGTIVTPAGQVFNVCLPIISLRLNPSKVSTRLFTKVKRPLESSM